MKGSVHGKVQRRIWQYLVLFAATLTLSSCSVYVALPGKTVWIAYPPDSALVPPEFTLVTGGAQTSVGVGYEAFGGDVAHEARSYHSSPVPIEVRVDGRNVARLTGAFYHSLRLRLTPGVHRLTVQSGTFFRKRTQHIHLTVWESYPFQWEVVDEKSIETGTTFRGNPASLYPVKSGGIVVQQLYQAIRMAFLREEAVVWENSMPGYMNNRPIPFPNGVYVLVHTLDGDVIIFWLTETGATSLLKMPSGNMWMAPVVCGSGMAILVIHGEQGGVYIFDQQGSMQFYPNPPPPEPKAAVFPGAYCDNGVIRPQWVVEYSPEGKQKTAEIRTLERQFPLPAVGTLSTLLKVGDYWVINSGERIYLWWKNEWRPLYVPPGRPPQSENVECQPPVIGLGLLGFIPFPVLNTQLRCEIPYRFYIQGEIIETWDGRRLRVKVKEINSEGR